MALGSVEYAVIAFPGNKFKGEIVPAMQELVDKGIVRILDLAFIKKDADGSVAAIELSSLPPEEAGGFESLQYEVGGLLSDDDFEAIAEELPDDSSAGLIVWENRWMSRFVGAVMNADGFLVAHARIPAEVVNAAVEYAAQARLEA